jgi:hypothetical protein
MLVDVYKSNSAPQKFLSLPAGTDIKKFSFGELNSDYRNVLPFEMDIEVDPAIPRAGFINAIIVEDIADHGFSAHTAEISVVLRKR